MCGVGRLLARPRIGAQFRIDVGLIDRIAREVIDYEAKKSTAFSFAAGLPGGVAMVGTIPADIT